MQQKADSPPPTIPTDRAAKLQVVSAGAQLAGHGLIVSGEGNLSVRLDSESMVISPSGADKSRLDVADLLTVSINDDCVVEGASIETQIHRAIYRRFPRVVAIAHAHPVAGIKLAAHGKAPDTDRLVEGKPVLGEIRLLGRLPCGSVELAVAVANALDGASSCVLSDHGAVTTGGSMQEAVRRMIVLERLAQVHLADQTA